MSLEPGVLLSPKLRLDRKIADGGMGSVWLGTHLVLERNIAIKLLSPSLLRDDLARARFQNEARAIAQLKSPHVPEIFDVGETEDGIPFIAMEPLEGEDLRSRLTRAGRLSVEDTATLVAHVAAALHEAHAHGIVHRDVKPENIFLVPSDDGGFVAKLLDFGIAKSPSRPARRLTTDSGPLGTPGYMSPEQLLSGPDVDARSDLWSLAVVAYESLTGRQPFRGPTYAAVSAAIASGGFPAPSRLRTVPPTVDAWFRRALKLEPAARFADAFEMSRAFRDATLEVVPFPLRRSARAAVGCAPGDTPERTRAWGWLVLGGATLAGVFALSRASWGLGPARGSAAAAGATSLEDNGVEVLIDPSARVEAVPSGADTAPPLLDCPVRGPASVSHHRRVPASFQTTRDLRRRRSAWYDEEPSVAEDPAPTPYDDPAADDGDDNPY